MIIQKIKRRDDDQHRKGGGASDERATIAALARAKGKSFWHEKTRAHRPGKGGTNPRPPGIHKQDFRIMCEYLIEGKGTPENERPHPDGEGRVADAFSLNLPTAEDLQNIDATGIREAEKWMADTAALNTRIRATAVLHYVVALPAEETQKATPEFWRHLGPEILKTLDMPDHQALFVVHEDAEHPHMHVVINRVHPTTHKAKSPFQDMVALERLVRQLERKFGLRKVKGRLINPLTNEKYTAEEIKAGARPGKRKPRAAMAEVRRVAKKSLKTDKPFTHATSWPDLEQRLEKHGYSLRAEGAGLMLFDAKGQAVKVSEVAGKGMGRRKLEERFGNWNDHQADKLTASTHGVSLAEAAHRRAAEDRRKEDATKVASEKRKAEMRARLVPMLEIGVRIVVTSEDPREPTPDYLGAAMSQDELCLGLEALSPDEIARLHRVSVVALERVSQDQREMLKMENGRNTPAYFGAENARINLDAAVRMIKTHALAHGVPLDAPQSSPEKSARLESTTWKAIEAKAPDASPKTIAKELNDLSNEALFGHLEATRKASQNLQAIKRRDGNTPERAGKSLRLAAAIRGLEFALKERGLKVRRNPYVQAKVKSRGMEM